MDWLNVVWSFELRIAPVLVAWGICLGVDWIRKYRGLYYIPMYFPFLMPELNANLALYLGDDFLDEVREPEGFDPTVLRRKILLVSLMSVAISVLVQPALLAVVFAFFVPRLEFWAFVATFLVYRCVRAVLAFRDFKEHAIATKWNKRLLATIYVLFVPAVAAVYIKVYSVVEPLVSAGSWAELAVTLADAVFWQAIVLLIIFAGLVALFSQMITDTSLRRDQIECLSKTSSQD
jgi:hypothetical protein